MDNYVYKQAFLAKNDLVAAKHMYMVGSPGPETLAPYL